MDSRIKGRFLGVRLFLEGIELEVTSVKVSCAINTPGTAAITIPVADEAHKFKPRTLVHLFYFSGEFGNLKEFNDDNTVSIDNIDKNNWRNWNLLFVGEVMGYSFKKMGARREIILACRDHTSYWDSCRLYWGKTRSSVFNAYKTAIFSGATQLYRGKSKVDDSKDLLYLLQKKPSSMPNVPGLLGGIFSLLESATGCFSPDASKKFLGCNDFMSQAEIRLKLTRQVGASAKDDTSATFTSSKSFRRYLLKISKQASYTASFMEFVNMLMGKIYHVWNSQAAPPYFSEKAVEYSVTRSVGGGKYKYHSAVSAFARAVRETYELANAQNDTGKTRGRGEGGVPSSQDYMVWKTSTEIDVETHQAFDDLNVKKGIMSAAIGSSSGIVWGDDNGPLRRKGIQVRDALIAKSKAENKPYLMKHADKILRAYSKAEKAREIAAKMARIYSLPWNIAGVWGGRKQSVGIINYNAEKMRAVSSRCEHTRDNYKQIRVHLEDALAILSSLTKGSFTTKKEKVVLKDRLLTTYFHPDLFMVPPPKCNVLFPDHIQTISFSRGWMSEITRLWLHGRTESGKNSKDCYFSPNSSILNGPAGSADEAVRNGASFIMPHEKFTGVVPSIVGLGDADIFKTLHKLGLAEAKKEATEAGKTFDATSFTGEAQFSPQPHLQRAANYMFFSRRYSSRSMELTCRYSPQLVVGMPALVLDPDKDKSRVLPFGRDSRIDPEDEAHATGPTTPKGTHYIGLVAGVTHMLDAVGGAQTVVSLIKCREHREEADLFGSNDDGTYEREKTKTSWKKVPGEHYTLVVAVTPSDVLIADTEPKSAKTILGRKWDPKVKYRVRAVTGPKESPSTDGTWANTAGWVFKEARWKNMISDLPRGNSALSVEPEGGYPEVKVYVEYRVSGTTTEKLDFTWEASVLPPWFSNIYSPRRIGPDFYQQMYGCGSVVDDPPFRTTTATFASDSTSESEERFEKQKDAIFGEVIRVPFATKDGLEYKEIRIPGDLLEHASTSEHAADQLANVWLALKEIEADTDLFIERYTNRKYANMLEVMGNMNTSLRVNILESDLPVSLYQSGHQTDDEGLIRGFHGDAYGEHEDLTDWDGKPLEAEPLVKVNEPTGATARKVSGSIDPRAERYAKVEDYVRSLKKNTFRSSGLGTFQVEKKGEG